MELPQPGQTFEGKYTIRQTLGEGGFAMVYRATDNEIQRDVAIKILTPRSGSYPEKVVARFMREARVIASLQDPHTIKLFEFGESSTGLLYMVFQYVSGLDLQTIVRRRGRLPPEVVAHVTTQVLSALTEAHAAGILHRDLKPANVLVHEYMGDEYSVKLLDFGIAKVDEQESGVSLTKTGALLGTPRYMAPEQVFGERLGPWTDIYSLGLVAYEMLVGEPAIDGSKEEMLRAQVSEEPILLPYDVGWLTLRQAIERMLARAPAHRFQTAQDAHKAIRYAMKFRREGLPSGPLPSQSAISGPIPPLPYSSGTHVPAANFSSGFVTPNPDFSSGSVTPYPTSPTHSSDMFTPSDSAQFTSGYSTGESFERPRSNRALVVGSAALAVVVGGVAAYLSTTSEPPPPTIETREVPNALLVVPETAEASTPVESETVDTGPASEAADRALVPAGDGCGNEYSWQRERFFRVKTFANSRAVQAFLPRNYDANKRYAMIIALQPPRWDVKQYVVRSELSSLIEKHDVLVFGIEPVDRFDPWVDPADVAIVKATATQAVELFCIDRSQVYVVGTAAGGRLAREVACEMPLSGLATTGDGELLHAPSCTPPEPVPRLWILGKKDHFAPMNGGTGCAGGEYLSADRHDELWTERNGCSNDRKRWLDKSGSKCWSWDCSGATYASCRASGGHYVQETSWDRLDSSACAAPPLGLQVGPTVWEFFEAHGKRLDVPDLQ